MGIVFVMKAQSIKGVFAQKWFINIKIQEKEEFSVYYSLLTELSLRDYSYWKTSLTHPFILWMVASFPSYFEQVEVNIAVGISYF